MNHKHKEIYDFIVNYKAAHNGNSPSIRDICQAVGLASTNTALRYLHSMETNGLIKVERGTSRAISVPGGVWSIND